MNTMKREDMIKEKMQLEGTILNGILRLAFPVVSWISAVQRHMYLCNQIDKSTPKPSAVKGDQSEELTGDQVPLD